MVRLSKKFIREHSEKMQQLLAECRRLNPEGKLNRAGEVAINGEPPALVFKK